MNDQERQEWRKAVTGIVAKNAPHLSFVTLSDAKTAHAYDGLLCDDAGITIFTLAMGAIRRVRVYLLHEDDTWHITSEFVDTTDDQVSGGLNAYACIPDHRATWSVRDCNVAAALVLLVLEMATIEIMEV